MEIGQFTRISLVALLTVIVAACASEQAKQTSAPALARLPAETSANAPAPTAASRPVSVPTIQPVAVHPVQPNPLADPKGILARRSVYYDFDTYTIKPEFRPMVEAHAAYLREHRGASLLIEGNGDERGGREYNLALGQRRAEAVKSMMVLLGVSERQIETVSFGEEKPKAVGHEESAWAQNRRSDIVYRREQ